MKTQTKTKAIGYTRVSSEEQAKEGISLDAQEHKIKAYAEVLDFDLVSVVRDEGKSGKNLLRKGLQTILMRIEKGEVDTVIVYKLDRLSRRTLDNLSLIDQFDHAGIAFHSIQEKIDTKTAMGRFFLTIIAAYAQMERELIVERTRDALAYKKTKGEVYGEIPYGYHRVKGKLVEDKEEQKIIRYIRNLRTRGHSFREIARRLEKKGFQTKKGRKTWHHSTVQRVFQRTKVALTEP